MSVGKNTNFCLEMLSGQSPHTYDYPLFLSDLRGLRAPHMVERLQDQAQAMLGEYCRSHSPDQQVRFGKLLLMLPSLRSVSPKMIEDLFFRGALDNVPIERMLCDMFKSS